MARGKRRALMRRSSSASYTLLPDRSPSTAISMWAEGCESVRIDAVDDVGFDRAGHAERAEADGTDGRPDLDQHDRSVGDEPVALDRCWAACGRAGGDGPGGLGTRVLHHLVAPGLGRVVAVGGCARHCGRQ